MNFLYKIPGYILLMFGGFCLSWGGFIVKSFENSSVWQILFLRSLFFLLALSIFLLITYKGKTLKVIKDSGYPAAIGGLVMSFSFISFVVAMSSTTVANVVFIISTQSMFLAIFGYLFLKETISSITLASIILAITGVLLMVGNSLSPGEMSGNLAAFSMPITFAILIIIVRKFPTVDMVPAQFIAGVSSCFIGFLLSEKLMISSHDIFLGFTAGFFQVGFGFIFITMGARSTPSAMVGIIMLSESVLGPMWAFLFAAERPSLFTLIGGGVILFAVLLQFYSLLFSNKKEKIIN